MIPLLAMTATSIADATWPPLTVACCTLVFVGYLVFSTLKSPIGDDEKARKMEHISGQIQEGAEAFLMTEFKYLAGFALVVGALISVLRPEPSGLYFVAFIFGALFSASCGYIGMSIAVRANIRTCHACRSSLNEGLQVAFKAGSVMGFSVVSVGLLGVTLFFLVFGPDAYSGKTYMAAFGFGASSVALFARVAGGIYTKAADCGADLVGKVESGIPEDDPRNPAVIADNVGDNVGDVAGMGADLFESYVGSIIACAALGAQYATNSVSVNGFVALPFYIAGVGIIASALGVFAVRCPEGADQAALLKALDKGIIYAAGTIFIGLAALVIFVTLDLGKAPWRWFVIIIIGLVTGVLIGKTTEYYTSFEFSPTRHISRAAVTGPATVIIQGLSVGMESVILPSIYIGLAIWGCIEIGTYETEGPGAAYSVALAAVGLLSTLGVDLAADAFGPIADNAGGIAEMAGLPADVRDKTDGLDALGNTTAAVGKGFAIGSAVLTAFSLMQVFASESNLGSADILQDTKLLPGAILGASLPYYFAAYVNLAVNSSATEIIQEVRRQFAEKPGIMAGTEECDPRRCVKISTTSALKFMVVPGVLAIAAPVTIGLIMGRVALAGSLVGGILSSYTLALFSANAGGAWDNSKKWVERGEDELLDGKGSAHHDATIVGDVVGDPLKDTSGPALNVLMKLMSLVALTFAPTFEFVEKEGYWWTGLIFAGIVLIIMFFWRRYMDRTSTKLEELLSKSQRGSMHIGQETREDAESSLAPTGTEAATEETTVTAPETLETTAVAEVPPVADETAPGDEPTEPSDSTEMVPQ